MEIKPDRRHAPNAVNWFAKHDISPHAPKCKGDPRVPVARFLWCTFSGLPIQPKLAPGLQAVYAAQVGRAALTGLFYRRRD